MVRNLRKQIAIAVVLLAASGTALALDGDTWIRTYRGGYGHSVYETSDGGAVLGGTFGAGGFCCQPWLIKLAPDGSVVGHKTYESPGLAGATNIVPTLDGGFVMAGDGTEFRVVKVDANGSVQWTGEYGDGGYTHLRVLESKTGNILVTGRTTLLDRNFHSNGRAVLLDPDGGVLWQKVYGTEDGIEYLSASTLAYNGNFIVVGSYHGDFWVMELDQDGNVVWQKRYGGTMEDNAQVVTRAMKHYYLVVGSSDSYGGEGLRNWWGLLISKSGKIWREFSLGGLDAEDPLTAIETSDGGFIIGGGTGSYGSGFSDVWLVKFDARARIEWQKSYGRRDRTDHAWHIQETEQGFVVIGDSYYFPADYDVLLMTLDRDGNILNGTCGETGDTDAVAFPTEASTDIDAGALAWDTDIRAGSFKVSVVDQVWPPESCEPLPE